MGRVGRARGRRRRLRGWFKWVVFLALPFGVVFAETYLHTRRLSNDYEMNAIREELARLSASITIYKAEQAKFGNLEFWQARATELGFVPPQPDQIESVHADSGSAAEVPPPADPTFASLDSQSLEPLPLPPP